MPVTAPLIPSTAELEQRFGWQFGDGEQDRLTEQRAIVGRAINGELDMFLGIVGPCAMTDTVELDLEGNELLAVTRAESGLYALHRMPPWKPRSDPEAWHGLETTDPETAYAVIVRRAVTAANVSLEFGQPYHPQRYGGYATFGWIGSRNVDDTELIRRVALHPATLGMPLGIKNGMSGNVTAALQQVNMVNELRGEGGAPAVLIFRGGADARSPEAWEELYIDALLQSRGRMIVDMAHGAEMAHDPDARFNKSDRGQLNAQAHYLYLAERGLGALGLMHEASAAGSPVDPPIPFLTAVNGIKRAAQLRTGSLSVSGKL